LKSRRGVQFYRWISYNSDQMRREKHFEKGRVSRGSGIPYRKEIWGPGTSEFLGSSSTYVRPNLVEVDYAKPDKRRVFNVSWSKTRTNVTCCVRVKCRIASALSQYMQSANAECVIRAGSRDWARHSPVRHSRFIWPRAGVSGRRCVM